MGQWDMSRPVSPLRLPVYANDSNLTLVPSFTTLPPRIWTTTTSVETLGTATPPPPPPAPAPAPRPSTTTTTADDDEHFWSQDLVSFILALLLVTCLVMGSVLLFLFVTQREVGPVADVFVYIIMGLMLALVVAIGYHIGYVSYVRGRRARRTVGGDNLTGIAVA
ncbi:hypothetical protein C8A00DRAFT_32403 [Chaetomidium leptoderma]|uniref:Transmembrane protein n=1 Tax=Chaetomidium leptoderma TaxID=669021 RepID=A0AAN6ZXS9_9PEZI|nr:hypothetical protein C8A00DRAFT_32403 [Chaetomidium leptoderma]